MLTVGVGCRPGADLTALVAEALTGITARPDAQGGLAARPDAIATIDRRAAEAAAVAAGYGCPVVTFTAEELAAQPVPAPSRVVAGAVGTPSVAEAAALLAAGPGARLLVGKRGNGTATVAVAVR